MTRRKVTKPRERAEPAEVIHTFPTSGEAWAFMRECDARGHMAGYPSLTAPYTVRVCETPTDLVGFAARVAINEAASRFALMHEGQLGSCFATDIKHDERAIIAHPDQAFAWSISCYGTHMVRVGTPYECEGALRYDNVGVTFGRESNRAREMLRAVAEINEPHIELHMWDGRALVRCATQQDFVEQWERAVMRAALAELERRIPLYGEDIEGRIVAVRATLEARP